MLVYSLVLLTATVIVNAQESNNGVPVIRDGTPKPNIWEGSCNPRNPICRRRGCQLPPFPDNGDYQMKDPKQRLKPGTFTGIGTTLVYFCDDDHELSTDETVCLGSNKWTAIPECKLRRKHTEPCALPGFPKSGSYYIQNVDKNTKVGDLIAAYTMLVYSCDQGFELTKNVSICLNGAWSSDPKCVPIKDTRCILPPHPVHGSYDINPNGFFNTTPGQFVSHYTILEYTCDYGYEPSKRITVCGDNNRWSSLPVCRARASFPLPSLTKDNGCTLPAKPDHGFYTVLNYEKTLLPGDLILPFSVLNFYCEANYEPSKRLAVCTQDKTWSSNVTCQKSCEMMSSQSVNFICLASNHSRVACARFVPHGSTAHPFCRAGHSPVGILETLRCVEGTWDSSVPECQPDEGKTPGSWNFGIFQEFGGNVLPMCVFLEGQVAIRVPQWNAQTNNQQRLPANYYTFEKGKFYKLPDDQLEQAIFDSSENTIQGIATPGKANKPKKPKKKPSLTTPNEIFPSLSPSTTDSPLWPEKPQTKCKTKCDDNQIFGDFVASTLRNFNSDQNKRKLKLSIQELILEATKDDDYVSFVLTPDATVRALYEEGPDYIPDVDEVDSPSGIDTRSL